MTAPDPLLRSSNLLRERSLPVLGIDTLFDSNSNDVLEIVEQSFGRWDDLPHADRNSSEHVRVRIMVTDGIEGTTGRSLVSYTSGPDRRLVVQSRGSIGYVDPLRRESVACVTSELLCDRDHFRVTVLEAITLALLACFDRHPIHAAAITQGNHTALLAGLGGSGKSTLAYLAHAEGFDVLGDDHVWLQLEPECRIWGGAPQARLRSEAAAHFPEVAHPGGDKLAIHLRPRHGERCLVGRGPVVCILARGYQASLSPLEPLEVEAELGRQLSPGFDRFPERNHAAFNEVSRSGGWRLTLSNNPRDAVPLLHRVLDGR
jgi:hypothetical protein